MRHCLSQPLLNIVIPSDGFEKVETCDLIDAFASKAKKSRRSRGLVVCEIRPDSKAMFTDTLTFSLIDTQSTSHNPQLIDQH